MCQIIHCPPNQRPSDELIKRIFAVNSDGIGVFYPHKKRIVARKALPKTATEALDFIHSFDDVKDKELGIHFRYRTSGNINEENTHPFTILTHKDHGRDLMLMHNGVLPITGDDKSDTWYYARMLGGLMEKIRLKESPLEDPYITTMLRLSLGSGNKLLMLDGKAEKFYRINESAGHLVDDTWFSASISQYKKTTTYHYQHNGRNTSYDRSYFGYGYGNHYDDYGPSNSTVEVLPKVKFTKVIPPASQINHPVNVMKNLVTGNHKKNPKALLYGSTSKSSLKDFTGITQTELSIAVTSNLRAVASMMFDMIMKESASV